MAKQFGGFTPEQLGKIDPAMAGMQADEQVKYMAANPGVSSRVGNMAQQAKRRIAMANGGVVKKQGYAPGGVVDSTTSTGGSGVQPEDNTPNLGQPMTYDPITGLPNNDARDSFGMPIIIDDPNLLPITKDPVDGNFPIGKPVGIPLDPTIPPELPTMPEAPEMGERPNDTLTFDPSDIQARGAIKNWIGSTSQASYIVLPDGKRIESDTGNEEEEVANVKRMAEEYIAQKKLDAADWDVKNKDYLEKKSIYDKGLEDYKSYYSQQGSTGSVQSFEDAKAALSSAQSLKAQYDTQLANMAADDPNRATLEGLVKEQQLAITQATNNYYTAEKNFKRQNVKSAAQLQAEIQADPTTGIVKGEAEQVSDLDIEKGKITGEITAGDADTAVGTTAVGAEDIDKATEFDAKEMTAKEAADEVKKVMDTLTAATGKPSEEAIAEAATMDPQKLAQLGLTVAQIENAQKVIAPDKLVATPDQLISGPTVDFEKAKKETNFTAATGAPSSDATVQGQLTQLMADFEGNDPPAWAAGAMRAATSIMAGRGLAASSMAGQAVVQAAMESALPIAMQDAQTIASFEAQGLSNRQQAAMFNAEQRAKFLGMEFDQKFQVRVQNASRIADVANINFTAEQQVALENARMAQTVDITNLTAKNAKIMSDAAAMSQLDLSNLTNLQQANVQKATAFLQFDMTTLNNQQQVAMFKAQSVAGALLSDASAINAERQFNASSANQVDMFFSNLQTQIDTFNKTQTDTIALFNAGEANAVAQFNTAQANARDQFNTQNALVIAQSNAVWDQAVVTQETAAQNEMNKLAAQAANDQAAASYAATQQQERDKLSYAFTSTENENQREHALVLAELQNDGASEAAKGTAAGVVIAKVVEGIFSL